MTDESSEGLNKQEKHAIRVELWRLAMVAQGAAAAFVINAVFAYQDLPFKFILKTAVFLFVFATVSSFNIWMYEKTKEYYPQWVTDFSIISTALGIICTLSVVFLA